MGFQWPTSLDSRSRNKIGLKKLLPSVVSKRFKRNRRFRNGGTRRASGHKKKRPFVVHLTVITALGEREREEGEAGVLIEEEGILHEAGDEVGDEGESRTKAD